MLLILTMLLGLDRVQWIDARQGIGGNLPFLNFPGPKFWATAAVMHFGGRYSWDSLVSRSTLLALNVAAIWLLTLRAQAGRCWLQRTVRWTPVVALALTFAFVAATRHGRELGVNFDGVYYGRFYLIVVALGELPATLLLYWWLARIARELDLPQLAWSFRRLAMSIVAVVGAAAAMCLSSRWLPGTQKLPEILGLASVYAVVALAAAVWALAALVSLATAALMRPRENRAAAASGSSASTMTVRPVPLSSHFEAIQGASD